MKTKDIRINKELIMKYEPCLGGLANFKRHYTDISITELINSENINYDHKIRLLRHIVPTELLVLWALDGSIAAYEYSACYEVYAAAVASIIANAGYPDYVSRFAYHTSSYIHSSSSWNEAKNERLQSLLYFIENED